MRTYNVREFSDKLDKQFKPIVLAEYNVEAESISDAQSIVDKKRNTGTKEISMFDCNGDLCAQWAAEGLTMDNGKITGTYRNEWFYTSKHEASEKDIFDGFFDDLCDVLGKKEEA